METFLAYAGPIVAFIGGVTGLVLTKEGKWTPIRVWGPFAFASFAILVAGSGLAMWKVRDTLQEAAAARAEADAAANREAAGQRTMLGGFDFSRPFEIGSFYLDVDTGEGGTPVDLDGFVGPFPSLGPGASGLLTINVRDGFYYEFRLAPAPGGRLQLINADGASPAYVLSASSNGAELGPAGAPAGWREVSRYAGGPLRAGQWAAMAQDDEFAYHLGIASPEPLRRIVSGLAGSRSYGSLRLHLPGVPEARRQAIAQAYSRITPYFVFYAPLASGASNPDCVTRIRVPMEMRRVDADDPDDLVLQLAAARHGFDTETCETAYIP